MRLWIIACIPLLFAVAGVVHLIDYTYHEHPGIQVGDEICIANGYIITEGMYEPVPMVVCGYLGTFELEEPTQEDNENRHGA